MRIACREGVTSLIASVIQIAIVAIFVGLLAGERIHCQHQRCALFFIGNIVLVCHQG